MSQATLGQLNAELWSPPDLAENHDLMAVAGTPEWALALHAMLKPFSAIELRVLNSLPNQAPPPLPPISTLPTKPNFQTELASEAEAAEKTQGGDGSNDAGGGGDGSGGGDDVSGGGGDGKSGQGSSAKPTTATAGEATPATTGTSTRSASLKAASSKQLGPTPATLQSTPPRTLREVAAATPAPPGSPTQAQDLVAPTITTRTVADVNKMTELREQVTGMISALHEEFPLLLEMMLEGGEFATVARAPPFLLGDIARAIKRIRMVLKIARAVAIFEVEAASPQGRELERAVAEHEVDKALRDTWMRLKSSLGPVGTAERLYGVPPIVGVMMAMLKGFFTSVERSSGRWGPQEAARVLPSRSASRPAP